MRTKIKITLPAASYSHMALVMSVSEKVVALEFGMKIAEGTPDEVRNEPEVIRAYLGDAEDAHAA